MPTHIIESIGSWGVRTTPASGTRFAAVNAGDIVRFPDQHRKYPVSCAYCRVAGVVNGEEQIVQLVDGMGSAFLNQDGSLSISGGPFFSIPMEFLDPAYSTHQATFWNWGDNSPGAGQGVEYHLDRPLFTALASPNDFTKRFSRSGESHARRGGEYRHEAIPEHARLVRSWLDHDGLTAYLFDVRA